MNRRWILALLLLGVSIAPAHAQGPCPGITSPVPWLAAENITVGTSAVGFTAANTSGAVIAVVVVETAPIRYLSSGTPTATVGTYSGPNSTIIVCGSGLISTWKSIRDTSATASASLGVEYFGRR